MDWLEFWNEDVQTWIRGTDIRRIENVGSHLTVVTDQGTLEYKYVSYCRWVDTPAITWPEELLRAQSQYGDTSRCYQGEA